MDGWMSVAGKSPKKAKKIVRYSGIKYICPISFSNKTG